MAIQISGQNLKTGLPGPPFSQDQQGSASVSELHGRYYQQAYLGNLYSIGCQLTALSAATILLTNAAQPIVGVWNPPTSPVNLVITQAMLINEANATTTVAPGAFVWAESTGNNLLTAGLVPFNRRTLANAGSQAKAFSLSTASLLTGLTNNLVVFEPGDFNVEDSLAGTALAATTATPSAGGTENFDGSLIIPPGGVLALLNTVSTTTISVVARLMWEEVLL